MILDSLQPHSIGLLPIFRRHWMSQIWPRTLRATAVPGVLPDDIRLGHEKKREEGVTLLGRALTRKRSLERAHMCSHPTHSQG